MTCFSLNIAEMAQSTTINSIERADRRYFEHISGVKTGKAMFGNMFRTATLALKEGLFCNSTYLYGWNGKFEFSFQQKSLLQCSHKTVE